MDALLIIDMQNDCFDLTPRLDKEGVAQRINQVAASFRKMKKPIFFIQHDGTKKNYLYPNTKGWNIIEELKIHETDLFVTKTANDAFYDTHLDSMLRSRDIDTVYITGLATDFCINATIHSALTHDYTVIVIKECHTTADRPNLCAQQVIDFHNWIWHNLTKTKSAVIVKSLSEIPIAIGEKV